MSITWLVGETKVRILNKVPRKDRSLAFEVAEGKLDIQEAMQQAKDPGALFNAVQANKELGSLHAGAREIAGVGKEFSKKELVLRELENYVPHRELRGKGFKKSLQSVFRPKAKIGSAKERTGRNLPYKKDLGTQWKAEMRSW